MKLLFDFLPVLLFFIAFKVYDIYVATAVAIATSLIIVTSVWLRNRRIETMHIVTLLIVVLLGGATLILRNEMFIKWKPTVINWTFALVFLGSQYIGSMPLIKRMMHNNIILPDPIWQRLNISWIVFFALMGAANIYVAYNFTTEVWVNFKLFGILGATLVFSIAQAVYLARHAQPQN